jgi:hypothetical protein
MLGIERVGVGAGPDPPRTDAPRLLRHGSSRRGGGQQKGTLAAGCFHGMLGAGIMAGGLGSLVHHRLQKDDGTSCVLGSLPLGGPARIGVLLPESNLRRRARCRLLLSCPLGQRPARRASAQHGFQLWSGRRDFVRKWQRVGDAPRVNASSRAPSARLCRPCAAGAALRPGPAGLDRTTGAVCCDAF